MSSEYRRWTGIADEYDAVRAGSIDGTDTEAHDHGIIRAMNSTYRPNKGVTGDPECTVFAARLNHTTDEEKLRSLFGKYGQVKSVRLVKDVVTGFSKGYAFVEYYDRHDAYRAFRTGNKQLVDDKEILVELECERRLKGWIPRRLGGGLGGRKESGQLRFGGCDRPFRKPILFAQRTADAANHDFSDRERSGRDGNREERRGGRKGDERDSGESRTSSNRDWSSNWPKDRNSASTSQIHAEKQDEDRSEKRRSQSRESRRDSKRSDRHRDRSRS